MSTVRGGCHCGAVQYQIDAEPIGAAHCFCTDCQRITGTQMSSNVLFPKAAFKLTQGEPTKYSVTGDSGRQVDRYFCPRCGSSLWSEPQAMADVVVAKLSSLDGASEMEVGMSIYLDSAPKWASIPDSQAKFPKMPEGL